MKNEHDYGPGSLQLRGVGHLLHAHLRPLVESGPQYTGILLPNKTTARGQFNTSKDVYEFRLGGSKPQSVSSLSRTDPKVHLTVSTARV